MPSKSKSPKKRNPAKPSKAVIGSPAKKPKQKKKTRKKGGRRNGPKACRVNSSKARRGLPCRNLRTDARKPVPASDFDDSVGTMHRRPRERSHQNALSEIQAAERFRLRRPKGTGTGNPPDWIFPE